MNLNGEEAQTVKNWNNEHIAFQNMKNTLPHWRFLWNTHTLVIKFHDTCKTATATEYEYRLGEHLVSIEENQETNKKHWGEVHAEPKFCVKALNNSRQNISGKENGQQCWSILKIFVF